METPPEIVFRHIEPVPHVRERVDERVARLEKFFGRITSCHVAVEAPHQHHRSGNLYHVRVEVRVPGRDVVISGKPGDMYAHRDVLVAIRDAFDAVERDLKRWKQKADHDVKTHVQPLQGRVAELNPERDFGQIEMTDGRLVYFHRNSVVDPDFDALSIDDPVELVIQYGESAEGPQASTVRRIRPMQLRPEPS